MHFFFIARAPHTWLLTTYMPRDHPRTQPTGDEDNTGIKVGGIAATYHFVRMLVSTNPTALPTHGDPLMTAVAALCSHEVIDVRIAALERLAAWGKFVPQWSSLLSHFSNSCIL